MDKQNININVSELPEIICKCGSRYWKNAFILKKVSRLISPDGNEAIVPVPDMVCEKCGMSVSQIDIDPSEPEKPRLHLVK